MAKSYRYTLLFISWMVFVTFSSLSTFDGVHVSRFNIPHADKIIHFIFYFMACVLGVFFLRERTKGNMALKKALIIMVFATVAYGILMEVLQYTMTTSRSADILDGLANTTGSLIGAGLTKYFFTSKRWLNWKF